jgi:hypothetical protein
MNTTHSMQAARRQAIMLLDERTRKPKMTLGNLFETSRNSGRARAILMSIVGIITIGTGLIMAPTISAAGIMEKFTNPGAAPTDAAVQQAAFQFDLLANKAVIYGIPIVIAVAIYVAYIFARMSRRIAA